jgi:hypothetical protein
LILDEQKLIVNLGENDPIANFLFALKAPESRRQYTRRLEVFLDFLGVKDKGSFKEKAIQFYYFHLILLSVEYIITVIIEIFIFPFLRRTINLR